MTDLSTSYMGMSMPNPIVVSSSGLTARIEGVRKAVEAGAGAVVLKSLFEEDIVSSLERDRSGMSMSHPEAEAYLDQLGMLLEPDAYLAFVEECSKTVDVPVIASLNCHSRRWWTDYAERIENVGANAIELNLSPMSLDVKTTAADIENELVEMVKLARRTVKIPLAVKIGPLFSALPHLVNRLRQAGADGLTLFNRYYFLDIDIDRIELKSGNALSAHEELGQVLRWIGIVSDLTELDIAASTGIHETADVIKVILAGGDVAQLCTVLYREGLSAIGRMKDGMSRWMEEHGYRTIADFRSLLSVDDDKRNVFYQRLQYVKALKGK